jgi:hypothetical protein
MKRLMLLFGVLAIAALAAHPALAKGRHSGGHPHPKAGPHKAPAKAAHPAAKPVHPPSKHAHAADHPKMKAAKTAGRAATHGQPVRQAKAGAVSHKPTRVRSVSNALTRSVVVRRPGYGYGRRGYGRRGYYRHLVNRRRYRRGYAYGRPSFVRGPDQVVAANSGPHVVNPWATRVSAGGRRRGGALWFQVTRDSNPGLFRTPPMISATGVLTFQPAPGQTGAATIRVVLRCGGRSSTPQTFHITVRPG